MTYRNDNFFVSGFNLNLLECKSGADEAQLDKAQGFNLNLLECKYAILIKIIDV